MTNLELLRPKVMNAEVERRKKLARIGWALMGFAGLALYAWWLVYGAARAIDLGY